MAQQWLNMAQQWLNMAQQLLKMPPLKFLKYFIFNYFSNKRLKKMNASPLSIELSKSNISPTGGKVWLKLLMINNKLMGFVTEVLL